jgi:hypothetical protein
MPDAPWPVPDLFPGLDGIVTNDKLACIWSCFYTFGPTFGAWGFRIAGLTCIRVRAFCLGVCFAHVGSRFGGAIVTQTAFNLESHWVQWLGSIQAGSFKESSLYLTAAAGCGPYGATTQADQRLEQRVRLLHNAPCPVGMWI